MVYLARILAAVFLTISIGDMTLAQNILTVQVERDGSITKTMSFNEAELRDIGMFQVKTENAYVDSVKTFEGPLLRDLVAKLGAEDLHIGYMVAENDYTVEIPMREFFAYNVILALSEDGVGFSPRDKGPIWVIYPMSNHEELQEPKYNGRLIWQLDRIVFK